MSADTAAVTAELLDLIREFKGAEFTAPQGDPSGLNFFQDLGLDSLEMINLLFQVEQKYGVRLTDEDIRERDLMVLGKMATFISGHKQAGG